MSNLKVKFDQLTRGLFAGMNLSELRSVLRGDPPESPNPRYRAQHNSMLLHIRPRSYRTASTRFTHTFFLGFFTTFFFIVEVISGLVLMIYYEPTPEGAYSSILRLMTRVPFGELLRDIHRLAAEGMVIFSFLHLLRTFLTGSHKGERTFTWLTGVALLLLTLGLTYSGYLLPWDQLAYWAITIGTSMVETIPLVGQQLNTLLIGGEAIGADGLLRFYQLHVILLPLLAAAVLGAHYYRVVRKHSISLPARVEEGNLSPEEYAVATRKIDLIPDLLMKEIFLVGVGLLVLLGVSLFFYDAPLESHANPMHTPVASEAPWFFLWVQGLLKLGDKFLMGVIIPLVLIGFLFIIPLIDFSKSRRLFKRPFAILFTLLLLAGLGIFSWMGRSEYGVEMPAGQEISQWLAPEEGAGPLDQVPFDALTVGVYEAGKLDESAPESLQTVLAGFEQQLLQAQEAGRLKEGSALLIIEDWQQDLKRVTVRIVSNDLESGDQRTFERYIYIHRYDTDADLINIPEIDQ